MKIAIISDTHDNEINLIKALTLINKEKVSALIHCGDVCRFPTLNIILKNFRKKIFLVLGNGDDTFEFKNLKFKNLKVFEKYGDFILNNYKIGITHFPQGAKELTLKANYNFIFYGHKHFPWKEKINDTLLINPGNLAGILYPPTFAILDFCKDQKKLNKKNFNLKLIKL
jgi:putative phosphoesterase